jgi:membrane protease YdiL (CAAX protease family)
VFFALAHLNPWQFVFYLMLGAYLGWIQMRYQNIWLNVGAHAFNNALALVLLAYFTPAF